jgi:hypothetical protein
VFSLDGNPYINEKAETLKENLLGQIEKLSSGDLITATKACRIS